MFPTAEDMALWQSLSAAEQRAVIERDEEAGFRSGAAEPETQDNRLARVRASMAERCRFSGPVPHRHEPAHR